MSFHNKVCFEASTEVDGLKVSVEECAEYTSEISYEDAWFKANLLAKEKAEKKLEEGLEKISKKDLLEVIKLRGPRGCKGSNGKNGISGDLNELGYHFFVNENKIPKNLNTAITKLLGQIPSTPSQSGPVSIANAETTSQLNDLNANTQNYIKVTTTSGLVIAISVVTPSAYKRFTTALKTNPILQEFVLTNLIVTMGSNATRNALRDTTDSDDESVTAVSNSTTSSSTSTTYYWQLNGSTILEAGYYLYASTIEVESTDGYPLTYPAPNAWVLYSSSPYGDRSLTTSYDVIVTELDTNFLLPPTSSSTNYWYFTDSTETTIFTPYSTVISLAYLGSPGQYYFKLNGSKLTGGYNIVTPSFTTGSTDSYTKDLLVPVDAWVQSGITLTTIYNVIVPSYTIESSLSPTLSPDNCWYFTDSTETTIFTTYAIEVLSVPS